MPEKKQKSRITPDADGAWQVHTAQDTATASRNSTTGPKHHNTMWQGGMSGMSGSKVQGGTGRDLPLQDVHG